MKKLRWGVLGTAKIAVHKVIPAMQRGRLTEVVAIASRSADKARAAAQRLGMPRGHGSYEALLADPEVDAVYVPLPNDQHVPWSLNALEAGKHVLCEKPLGLSAAQARQLAEAGRRRPHLKLMEALMYRHHPQWRKAKELVQSGQVGTLRVVQTFLWSYKDDPANIRNDPARGGGALMDIGCYPISVARWLFEAEPRRVLGLVEYDPRFGVDRLAAVLDFGTGTGTFTCSTQLAPFQQVQILGTEGRVELSEVPFNARNDRPCVVRLQRGEEVRRIEVEVCNQYTLQGDLFARAVLDGTPVPTPVEDAVRTLEVIEAVVASGRSGGWVQFLAGTEEDHPPAPALGAQGAGG